MRSKGFDVVSIGADNPGVLDKTVMELAIAQERTILTFESGLWRTDIQTKPKATERSNLFEVG